MFVKSAPRMPHATHVSKRLGFFGELLAELDERVDEQVPLVLRAPEVAGRKTVAVAGERERLSSV